MVDAGIAEGLRQSQCAIDEEDARRWKDFANRLSYNLAADLAECWPNDTTLRERRHFERGLKAAENCIRWRTELNKPPFPFAIAWWAKGMHELSLARVQDSVASFTKAYEYGVKAVPAGEPTTVTASGAFSVILNAGYLGIARTMAGDAEGRKQYDEACAAFEQTAATDRDQEKKEDAMFGLAQLRHIAGKFILEHSH